jgi:hypothetical protein
VILTGFQVVSFLDLSWWEREREREMTRGGREQRLFGSRNKNMKGRGGEDRKSDRIGAEEKAKGETLSNLLEKNWGH